MAYQAELADYRQQARYNYASNALHFWPKIPGVGNVQVTGSPTYSVFRPGDDAGATAIASGTISPTTVDSVHKLSVTVDTTNTSTYVIDQYYRVTIEFVYSSVTYSANLYFDVARDPYLPLVSLNDLVDEVSDMESRCTAQGARVDSRTAEQHASLIGMKAWSDVQSWIRQAAESSGYLLPHAIADHEALKRVVVAQAVSRVYRAEGGSEGSESRSQADWWQDEARRRFDSMPPLRYDSDENRSVDTTLAGWSVVRTHRSW